MKPTGGRQHRRNEAPVDLDQQIWHAPHTHPAGAPPRSTGEVGRVGTGNEAGARSAGTKKPISARGRRCDPAGGPVLP
jgi:hypothetical protein